MTSSRLVAESPSMRKVLARLEESCRIRCPLLFLGEPGTGKQYLARMAHAASHGGAFIVFDAPTAGPKEATELLSSWTGRRATAYVREAWANPPLVARLLELAQGRPTLRIALGSRIPLSEPLMAPLRPVVARAEPIRVPALRERVADLPALASHFLAEPDGRRNRTLTPKALELLEQHQWPSNVAQLKRVCWQIALQYPEAGTIDAPQVERVLAASDSWLDELSFDRLVRAKLARLLERVARYDVSHLRQEVLDEVDRHLLELALAATQGNKLKAAKLLGISRNTLRKRVQELGIRPLS